MSDLMDEFETRIGQLKQKLNDGELSWEEYTKACAEVLDGVESRPQAGDEQEG